MDFLQLAEERYSVRKFTNQPVEQEKVEAILRAGQVAPTACNRQPQRILVIRREEELEKLKKCTKYHFHAPLAMLICYDKTECWERSFDGKTSGDVDTSIVTTQMMLEAKELGIGSTWVMYFDPAKMREEFQIPENYEVVSLLPMGYPAEDAKPAPGHESIKELSETVFYDKFV